MKRCVLASLDEPGTSPRAARVASTLADLFVQLTLESLIVPADSSSGGFGALVRTLAEGRADLGVVSGRSLPRRLPPEVRVAAVTRRNDPRYRLVGSRIPHLAMLPAASNLVAVDPGGRAQLLGARPDLLVDLPGLAPREILEGLRRGLWAAALMPSGITEGAVPWGLRMRPVETTSIVPPPASGFTAVLVVQGRSPRERQAAALDHGPARLMFEGEREFAAAFETTEGRVAAACAEIAGETMRLTGVAADASGDHSRRSVVCGESREAALLGKRLAAELLAGGEGTPLPMSRASSL